MRNICAIAYNTRITTKPYQLYKKQHVTGNKNNRIMMPWRTNELVDSCKKVGKAFEQFKITCEKLKRNKKLTNPRSRFHK